MIFYTDFSALLTLCAYTVLCPNSPLINLPNLVTLCIGTCALQDPHSDAAGTRWPHFGHLQGLR
jgi:hypothetical protein